MNRRAQPPTTKSTMWRAIAGIAALVLLAVAQVADRGYWTAGSRIGAGFIGEGDDLSTVAVRLAGGEIATFGGGRPALLLVFDPECAHSERVARTWAAWLSSNRPDPARILAVSSGPLAAAAAYARDKEWPVDVGTARSADDELTRLRIMSRTPWVFALDEDGRVIREGHGSRLQEVARSLSAGSANHGGTAGPLDQ